MYKKLKSLKHADIENVEFDGNELNVKYIFEGSVLEFKAFGVDFCLIENESLFFHREFSFESDGNGIWSKAMTVPLGGSVLERAIILIIGDFCVTCIAREFEL